MIAGSGSENPVNKAIEWGTYYLQTESPGTNSRALILHHPVLSKPARNAAI